jgi:hypothetical protein
MRKKEKKKKKKKKDVCAYKEQYPGASQQIVQTISAIYGLTHPSVSTVFG